MATSFNAAAAPESRLDWFQNPTVNKGLGAGLATIALAGVGAGIGIGMGMDSIGLTMPLLIRTAKALSLRIPWVSASQCSRGLRVWPTL